MTDVEINPRFEALLEFLQRSRGFDFSGYKRASLMRRIKTRMDNVGLKDYDNYMDYLEVHPDEFEHLFNTILINVTTFFRDQPAWDFLSAEVLPKLIENKSPQQSIRAWCAGVASGEEAYSLAISLCEKMGKQDFLARVKIYATDMDDDALNTARVASYAASDLGILAPEVRQKYFELVNGRYVFQTDLRRAVIFGRHDLIQDSPISRLDLLVCRNTLMYFNLETQTRILNRFHFALNDRGYLFLGKAEMLLTHPDMFSPIDLRYRIFTKIPRLNGRERLFVLPRINDEETTSRMTQYVRLREASFDAIPVAQVAIDINGVLTLANSRARALFGLRAKDIGRSFHELELSYRPIELRSRIDEVYADRKPLIISDAEYPILNQESKYLLIHLMPLEDQGAIIGVSITFEDVTRQHHLQEDVQRSRQALETAYEELQSANEELETTNEELQSTVEELQTTNEELQSTNEELETMNEELQSTNSEMEASNTELHKRSEELDNTNAFLGSILGSLQAAVIVVDRNVNIVEWNRKAEDMWGLRNNEVHLQSFFNLDIGLPVEQLAAPIRECISGGTNPLPLTLQATNRRGKTINVRVACSPLMGAHKETRGIIIMMEQIDG